jgi:hypothetical protein
VKSQRLLVPWLMVIVGLASLVTCLVSAGWRWNFIRTSLSASGTVVEMVPVTEREGSTTYSPVFVFRDANDEEHRIKCGWSSYPPAFAVGDAVTVIYPASNPESAAIDRWMALWGLSFVTGALGLIFTALGLAVARVPWLQRQMGYRNVVPT